MEGKGFPDWPGRGMRGGMAPRVMRGAGNRPVGEKSAKGLCTGLRRCGFAQGAVDEVEEAVFPRGFRDARQEWIVGELVGIRGDHDDAEFAAPAGGEVEEGSLGGVILGEVEIHDYATAAGGDDAEFLLTGESLDGESLGGEELAQGEPLGCFGGDDCDGEFRTHAADHTWQRTDLSLAGGDKL